MLLRKRSQPVAKVLVWCAADGAVLWLDQRGKPRTSFVTVVDGEIDVTAPYNGFIV